MAKIAFPTTPPTCEVIRVYSFRGDRTRTFVKSLYAKLDAEQAGTGRKVDRAEVLLYAGHTGISLDLGRTIYGFNPEKRLLTTKQLLNQLKSGDAFPGVVLDDTTIFNNAASHGLKILHVDVRVPPTEHGRVKNELASQHAKSQYSYGFPNGDGDCNCTTWVERIDIPLLTGRMDEMINVMSMSINTLGLQQRRFGKCV